MKDALVHAKYDNLRADQDVAAAGDVDPATDRVDVAEVLAPGRVSFLTSDPRASDLEMFAPP